jgi:hypothetical protein
MAISTDQTGWRIRTLVFMTIALTVMYFINFIFVTGMALPMNNYEYKGNRTWENNQTFKLSTVEVLLNTLFFGYIDNTYLTFMLVAFVGLCWMVVLYITYTFVKDWI